MIAKKPAKTLLIETQPVKALQIREMLNGQGSHVLDLAAVETLAEAEIHLVAHAPDIVLLDLESVEPSGLEAVQRVRAAAPSASLVLLSSVKDEPIAIKAMQEGAQDYLIKDEIEPRELIRALLNADRRKKVEGVQNIEKERAQATLDCIGDAVICTDTSGNITYLNPVAETMTGWALKDAVGQPMAHCARIVDSKTRQNILDPMAKASSQDRTGNLPLNSVLIRRDGHEVYIEDSVAPIHNPEGQVTGAVIVFRDVSAMRALEKELTQSAQLDHLTGLPNRNLLKDRIRQAILLARRNGCHAAVLFLDLDGFKQINDSLGHPIGDKVLQSVAKRLLDCVRSPDTIIRLGGDEFIVVLQELKRAEDAEVTVRRLLKKVAELHLIEQHQIYVTTSIGVSVYPRDGQDAETLIKNADTAMYHAKRDGKHDYKFFSLDINDKSPEHWTTGQELWHALNWYELTAGLKNIEPDMNRDRPTSAKSRR